MPRPSRQSSTVSTTSIPAIEQDAADRLGDDLAEEVGHRRDVAVDALDQLAGRVAAVELVVEAEHVAGHAQAQLVRRAPRGDRGEADDDDGDDLRGDGDGEEDQGEAHELAGVGAVGRLVDDPPHDERPGQRQRRADAPGARRGRPNDERRAAGGRSGRARATGSFPARRQSPARRPLAGEVGFETLGRMETDTATLVADEDDRRRDRRRSSRRSSSSRRSRSTGCAASTDAPVT